MKMSKCASCGADIVWARSSSGRKIPVDVDPDASGNVLLEDRDGDVFAVIVSSLRASNSQETGHVLRTSHFQTCPQAKWWRRRKTRQKKKRPTVDERIAGLTGMPSLGQRIVLWCV